jgi:hypothetical protein
VAGLRIGHFFFKESQMENEDSKTKLKFEDIALMAKALSFAAGLISTMPQFKDKHPEEVLDWLLEEGKKLD